MKSNGHVSDEGSAESTRKTEGRDWVGWDTHRALVLGKLSNKVRQENTKDCRHDWRLGCKNECIVPR